MVDFVLYVEGGGDTGKLHDACRRGFRVFLEKAGVTKNRPRIVACGGRSRAYDKFRTALREGRRALLLIDSEASVKHTSPWLHLHNRPGDGWTKPDNATDDHCHLMLECMENWFLADRETLRAFSGQDFRETALPPRSRDIETVPKATAIDALVKATQDCKPTLRYDKGERSFDLLARIDPAKVIKSSRWAKRFVTAVETAMSAPNPKETP